MTEIVRSRRLGDLTFGAPEDMSPEKKPWGFYDILGVARNASAEVVKAALRKLRAEYHPDKFARKSEIEQRWAEERSKFVGTVEDVLLDDGAKVGEEYTRRAQYDTISGAAEFFGDGHIKMNGTRTETLCEAMISDLERERRFRQVTHSEMNDPQIQELLRQGMAAQSREEAERIQELIYKRFAEMSGISVDEVKAQVKETQRRMEEEVKKQRAFVQDLQDHPNKYVGKVLDLYAVGDQETIRFCTCGQPNTLQSVQYTDEDHVVRIIGSGVPVMPFSPPMAHLAYWKQVHVKARSADVEIRDREVRGLIQVVEGSVTVDVDSANYGHVVRIRAPEINVGKGFEKSKDGLYLSRKFAHKGWQKREPDLDIAVQNGYVNLAMPREEDRGVDLSSFLGGMFGGGMVLIEVGPQGARVYSPDRGNKDR